ncbi:MAG: hypothetical protein ACE5IM_10240 [Nitrospinota bacterium]
MRNIRWYALGTVLCFALLGSVSMAGEDAYTAGDFAVSLAKVVTGRADYTAEDAAKLLAGMGVAFDGDLNAAVDQAFFVERFNELGATLVASNPDATMTKGDADRLLKAFDGLGGSASEAANPGTARSIKCKGNGPDSANPDPSFNQFCITDADCPGGFCKIPPGQAKKIGSPSDG